MHKVTFKQNIKRLFFNKDYKFFWRHETTIGNLYGVVLNRLGMLLLKLARKVLRKGGGSYKGKFYQNCSWCGGIQTRETGLHMHVSRKGSRCGISYKQCCDQPYV